MRFVLLIVVVIVPAGSLAAREPVRPPTPATHLVLNDLEEPAPGEHFYVMIFSGQRLVKTARYTHCWATVVHETRRGTDPTELQIHTISWMPATLQIRPASLHPERGANLGLIETVENVALAHRERVSVWGPYECRPRFYVRFLVQKAFLESGQIGYQCIDDIGETARKGNGCDCIHAITDMDPEYGRARYPLSSFGESAGREIVIKRLLQHNSLIHAETTHDWVLAAVGLEQYPMIRRQYDDGVLRRLGPIVSHRRP